MKWLLALVDRGPGAVGASTEGVIARDRSCARTLLHQPKMLHALVDRGPSIEALMELRSLGGSLGASECGGRGADGRRFFASSTEGLKLIKEGLGLCARDRRNG